ncbi:MAG TPA: hypothetical protein VKS78_04810 [Roseiarcus sp.]|nr:hypothetical protein [Roseiarcus sp.]
MGSKRVYVQSMGAKRNWTEKEWQIYENLPWAMQRIVDVLIRIPRFMKSTGQQEIAKADRRWKLMERKLAEAKQRNIGNF